MENPHTIEACVPSSLPSHSVPSPSPMENLDNANSDVHTPSVLPNSPPYPVAAPPPVPSSAPAQCPNSSDTAQSTTHKNFLQEYTQKSRLPLPLYKTLNEGSINIPKYRSTVLVDEVYYVSPNTFQNRKAAEHDAARIALEYISKKTKDDGLLLLQEDIMFCKSILFEYTDKVNIKRPTYTTNPYKGSIPFFHSSVVFDGVVYSGDVSRSKKEAEQSAARAAILSLLGNPKSQQTLAKIIASKLKFHATLQKVKNSHPSQIHPKAVVGNTEQQFGISVNEDKEVEHSSMVKKVEASATPEAPSTMYPFQPEYIPPAKPEASPHSVRLPIEFVPSNSEEPLGVHATVAKKRSKNKKWAHKKLRADNQLPTDHLSASQPPSLLLNDSAATGNQMN